MNAISYFLIFLLLLWEAISTRESIIDSYSSVWSSLSIFEAGTPMLSACSIVADGKQNVFVSGGHSHGVMFGTELSLESINSITWNKLNLIPKIASIYAAKSYILRNSSILLAVDERGSVIRSRDQGSTWHFITQLPSYIYSVSIGSNQQVFAAGRWGGLYTSEMDDNGFLSQWINLNVNHMDTIYDISTIDGINLIHGTSSGSFLWSRDSGKSWELSGDIAPGGIYCVAHSTPMTAFAAGEFSYVGKTINGGLSWTPIDVFDRDDEIVRYNSISVVNVDTIFVAGSSGAIFQSTNSGSSWVEIFSVHTTVYSLFAYNSSFLIASTTDFIVEVTNQKQVDTVLTPHNEFSNRAENLHIAGLSSPTYSPTGHIDYGEWQRKSLSGSATIFLGSAWENDYKVMMVGKSLTDGVVVTSNNSGINWQRPRTVSEFVFTDLVAYYESSTDTMYFVAASESYSILSTVDFGISWNSTFAMGAAMYGVTVGSNGVGYVVGRIGSMFKISSVDGFQSASELTLGFTVSALHDVVTIDGVHVYTVGADGSMFYSNNNGDQWTSLTSPTSVDLYTIVATDLSTMFVYGESNVVFKTTNSFFNSTTLSVFDSNSTTSIIYSLIPHALSALDSAIIFIGSFGGSIYVTNDGGISWSFTGEPARGQAITNLCAFKSNLVIAGDYNGNGYFLHPAPTPYPSSYPSGQPSCQPTSLPTIHPSSQPSMHPSGGPSAQPSSLPTHQPTVRPSKQPTGQPSLHPSAQPSSSPTERPLLLPTVPPSSQPTGNPSAQPFLVPTCSPTSQPSRFPSSQPSLRPSSYPSQKPSVQPTGIPTGVPSSRPSCQPVSSPSSVPSCQPSSIPTNQPVTVPSSQPSMQPSLAPSVQPTSQPTITPSVQPTSGPTLQPLSEPSSLPSLQPYSAPTMQPSGQPSGQPSLIPFSTPSTKPSAQPSQLPSGQPSSLPTCDPTTQPTCFPTAQPSIIPSAQPIGGPTSQPSLRPQGVPTSLPSAQPSSEPSSQPIVKPSSYPSSQPSAWPTLQPSSQPTRRPTSQIPTVQPSGSPSSRPSNQPSSDPSSQPSSEPTLSPSSQPTVCPTIVPSSQPSSRPSSQPFACPSTCPTVQPSNAPSAQPSTEPTVSPSSQPSSSPSSQPSSPPSLVPSSQPTGQPTLHPSVQPSSQPSVQPTVMPSMRPTMSPSSQPTVHPTSQPSRIPSTQPTNQPTTHPSGQPSMQPSVSPTSQPSFGPTSKPTGKPSNQPSTKPSSDPSSQPSCQPSRQPSFSPTNQPFSQPSYNPSTQPTTIPSSQPSTQPTMQPSSRPSCQPTSQPSLAPTSEPSAQPSLSPSTQPSSSPSLQPSSKPSRTPSVQPTSLPSGVPTRQPSTQPSAVPSLQPFGCPTGQPSFVPTNQPSTQPTLAPTVQPSAHPSGLPTGQPSRSPSVQPSVQPTNQPTSQPLSVPSSQPSRQPSSHPSAQPSFSPTVQPSTRPSCKPSAQPSSCPSVQPTFQPSLSPTDQPTCQPTVDPSSQPTSSPTAQPSIQPSCQPSNQPTTTPTSQPSSSPTGIPSSQPTSFPTVQPSQKPSSRPSVQPSSIPSCQPSTQPSQQPTDQPSSLPSSVPSAQPSNQPSSVPTDQPSLQPSIQPSARPSIQPSSQPSNLPTGQPSERPSSQPSIQPTSQPTKLPSTQPSSQPSSSPTSQPTSQPSSQPSIQPSFQPSAQPSLQPSTQPSAQPSTQPSQEPTAQPTCQPSCQPSTSPSSIPSSQPTVQPSSQPSDSPSSQPTSLPSNQPSVYPSAQPSQQPTSQPSTNPTCSPTGQPSSQPSSQPSIIPSSSPSSQPSLEPTSMPTTQPTIQPSGQPSGLPTNVPTSQPSAQPSLQPSAKPSSQPSLQPSLQPTHMPTTQPSSQPTRQPTMQPSNAPTRQPSMQPTTQPTTQPTVQPSITTYMTTITVNLTQTIENITLSSFQSSSAAQNLLVDISHQMIYSIESVEYVDSISIVQVAAMSESRFNVTQKLDLQINRFYNDTFGVVYLDREYSLNVVRQNVTSLLQRRAKSVNNMVMRFAKVVDSSFSKHVVFKYQSPLPTSQPSCQPSCQPSSQPSIQPSTQPTSQPTGDRARIVPSISFVIAGTNRKSVSIEIQFGPTPIFAGRIACAAISPVTLASIGMSSSLASLAFSRGVTTAYSVGQEYVGVTVSKLVPLGTYSVFCAASNSLNIVSDDASVRARITNITTSCCKEYSFAAATPTYLILPPTSFSRFSFFVSSSTESTSSESFRKERNKIVLALDYAPSNYVMFSFRFLYLDGSEVPSSFVQSNPSNHTVTSSFVPSQQVVSFSLTVNNISSATPKLVCQLLVTGSSAEEYYQEVLNRSFELVRPGQIPAPQLNQALLSDEGQRIFVHFDSPTNLGGLPSTSSWICGNLLVFSGDNSSICTWLNATTVLITLSSNTMELLSSQFESINTIQLAVRGNIISAQCLLTGSSVCSILPRAVTHTISLNPPRNAITPVISLQVPKKISGCASSIVLDASGTVGNLGFRWKNITWTIANANIPLSSSLLQFLQQQNSFNAHKSIPIVNLPTSLIVGGTYYISLSVTNIAEKSSVVSAGFEFGTNENIPLVDISGPKQLTMFAEDSLSLQGVISLSPCSTLNLDALQLSYSWTVHETDNGARYSVPSLSSFNRQKLLLSPFALAANHEYLVSLTVSYRGDLVDATTSATASVVVIVAPKLSNAIVVKVTGFPVTASTQIISMDTVLDASFSYDTDTGSSQDLSFLWSCTVGTMGSCPQSVLSSSVKKRSKWSLSVTSLFFNTTYVIHVTVSDRKDSSRFGVQEIFLRRSNAKSSYAIVSNALSSAHRRTSVADVAAIRSAIIMSENVPIFLNANDALLLTALVKVSTDPVDVNCSVKLTWSAVTDVGESISLESLSSSRVVQVWSTAGMAYVNEENVYAKRTTLVIPESVFSGVGTLLSFRLTVIQGEDTLAMSDVSIQVNSPPSSGALEIVNPVGISILGELEARSTNWIDNVDDLPLYYEYYINPSAYVGQMVIIKPISRSNALTTNFPSISLAEPFVVGVLLVRVYDLHYAWTNTSRSIITRNIWGLQSNDSFFNASLVGLSYNSSDWNRLEEYWPSSDYVLLSQLYANTSMLESLFSVSIQKLYSALVAKDYDAVVGGVGTFAASLSSVLSTCSLNISDPTTCFARYSRSPCISHNTCGNCLPGFVSAFPQANVPCVPQSNSNGSTNELTKELSRDALNRNQKILNGKQSVNITDRELTSIAVACDSDADCQHINVTFSSMYSFECSSLVNRCVPKSLPMCYGSYFDTLRNYSLHSCSGHGECRYVSNEVFTSAADCLTTSTCQARCYCEPNYSGGACEQRVEYTKQLNDIRQTYCGLLAIAANESFVAPSTSNSAIRNRWQRQAMEPLVSAMQVIVHELNMPRYSASNVSVDMSDGVEDATDTCLFVFESIVRFGDSPLESTGIEGSSLNETMFIDSSWCSTSQAGNLPSRLVLTLSDLVSTRNLGSSNATIANSIVVSWVFSRLSSVFMQSLASGERPTDLFSSQIQLRIYQEFVGVGTNSSYLIVQPPCATDDHCPSANLNPSSIGSNFEAVSWDGFATVLVSQFTNLLYGKQSLDTKMFRIEFLLRNRSLINSMDINSSKKNSSMYVVTLPFRNEQKFIDWTENMLLDRAAYNISYPTCQSYHSVTNNTVLDAVNNIMGISSLTNCPQCEMWTRTNLSATFRCRDLSNVLSFRPDMFTVLQSLPSESSESGLNSSFGARRLNAILHTTSEYLRHSVALDADVNSQELQHLDFSTNSSLFALDMLSFEPQTALMEIGYQVNSEYIELPLFFSTSMLSISMESAKPVIIVGAILFVAFLLGLLYFCYWDQHYQHIAPYTSGECHTVKPLLPKSTKNARKHIAQHNRYAALIMKQDWQDVLLQASIVHDEEEVKGSLYTKKFRSERLEVLQQLLQAFPYEELQLVNHSFFRQMYHLLCKYHAYGKLVSSILSLYGGQSARNGHSRINTQRRLLHWMVLSHHFLSMGALAALFFFLAFPDDGICQKFEDQSSCELTRSRYTGMPLCSWSIDRLLVNNVERHIHVQCEVQTPGLSITFLLVTCTLLLCLQKVSQWLVECLQATTCAHRPDLFLSVFGKRRYNAVQDASRGGWYYQLQRMCLFSVVNIVETLNLSVLDSDDEDDHTDAGGRRSNQHNVDRPEKEGKGGESTDSVSQVSCEMTPSSGNDNCGQSQHSDPWTSPEKLIESDKEEEEKVGSECSFDNYSDDDSRNRPYYTSSDNDRTRFSCMHPKHELTSQFVFVTRYASTSYETHFLLSRIRQIFCTVPIHVWQQQEFPSSISDQLRYLSERLQLGSLLQSNSCSQLQLMFRGNSTSKLLEYQLENARMHAQNMRRLCFPVATKRRKPGTSTQYTVSRHGRDAMAPSELSLRLLQWLVLEQFPNYIDRFLLQEKCASEYGNVSLRGVPLVTWCLGWLCLIVLNLGYLSFVFYWAWHVGRTTIPVWGLCVLCMWLVDIAVLQVWQVCLVHGAAMYRILPQFQAMYVHWVQLLAQESFRVADGNNNTEVGNVDGKRSLQLSHHISPVLRFIFSSLLPQRQGIRRSQLPMVKYFLKYLTDAHLVHWRTGKKTAQTLLSVQLSSYILLLPAVLASLLQPNNVKGVVLAKQDAAVSAVTANIVLQLLLLGCLFVPIYLLSLWIDWYKDQTNHNDQHEHSRKYTVFVAVSISILGIVVLIFLRHVLCNTKRTVWLYRDILRAWKQQQLEWLVSWLAFSEKCRKLFVSRQFEHNAKLQMHWRGMNHPMHVFIVDNSRQQDEVLTCSQLPEANPHWSGALMDRMPISIRWTQALSPVFTPNLPRFQHKGRAATKSRRHLQRLAVYGHAPHLAQSAPVSHWQQQNLQLLPPASDVSHASSPAASVLNFVQAQSVESDHDQDSSGQLALSDRCVAYRLRNERHSYVSRLVRTSVTGFSTDTADIDMEGLCSEVYAHCHMRHVYDLKQLEFSPLHLRSHILETDLQKELQLLPSPDEARQQISDYQSRAHQLEQVPREDYVFAISWSFSHFLLATLAQTFASSVELSMPATCYRTEHIIEESAMIETFSSLWNQQLLVTDTTGGATIVSPVTDNLIPLSTFLEFVFGQILKVMKQILVDCAHSKPPRVRRHMQKPPAFMRKSQPVHKRDGWHLSRYNTPHRLPTPLHRLPTILEMDSDLTRPQSTMDMHVVDDLDQWMVYPELFTVVFQQQNPTAATASASAVEQDDTLALGESLKDSYDMNKITFAHENNHYLNIFYDTNQQRTKLHSADDSYDVSVPSDLPLVTEQPTHPTVAPAIATPPIEKQIDSPEQIAAQPSHKLSEKTSPVAAPELIAAGGDNAVFPVSESFTKLDADVPVETSVQYSSADTSMQSAEAPASVTTSLVARWKQNFEPRKAADRSSPSPIMRLFPSVKTAASLAVPVIVPIDDKIDANVNAEPMLATQSPISEPATANLPSLERKDTFKIPSIKGKPLMFKPLRSTKEKAESADVTPSTPAGLEPVPAVPPAAFSWKPLQTMLTNTRPLTFKPMVPLKPTEQQQQSSTAVDTKEDSSQLEGSRESVLVNANEGGRNPTPDGIGTAADSSSNSIVGDRVAPSSSMKITFAPNASSLHITPKSPSKLPPHLQARLQQLKEQKQDKK